MISRVKRKKSATIPTIPRNSGPNRPCRYDTRPDVLSDWGAATIRAWNDIGLLRVRGIADGQQARRVNQARGHGCPTAWGDGAMLWTYQVPCCLTSVSA